MPFAATWMELETLKLSEVSQKEKDKYHMISHIWNLMYSTKENIPQKWKTWTWRRDLWLPDGRGREWEGSGAWAYQTQPRIDLQGDPAE